MEDGIRSELPPQPTDEFLEKAYRKFYAYPIDFLKPPSKNAEELALKLEAESFNPQIEKIAKWVDRANVNGLAEYETGSMFGLCGLSCESVKRASERFGYNASPYQVRQIQQRYGNMMCFLTV